MRGWVVAALLLAGVLLFLCGAFILSDAYTSGEPRHVVEFYGIQVQGLAGPAAVGGAACGLLAALVAGRGLIRRR